MKNRKQKMTIADWFQQLSDCSRATKKKSARKRLAEAVALRPFATIPDCLRTVANCRVTAASRLWELP